MQTYATAVTMKFCTTVQILKESRILHDLGKGETVTKEGEETEFATEDMDRKICERNLESGESGNYTITVQINTINISRKF